MIQRTFFINHHQSILLRSDFKRSQLVRNRDTPASTKILARKFLYRLAAPGIGVRLQRLFQVGESDIENCKPATRRGCAGFGYVKGFIQRSTARGAACWRTWSSDERADSNYTKSWEWGCEEEQEDVF